MVKAAIGTSRKNLLDVRKWVGGRIFDTQFIPSNVIINDQSVTIQNANSAMVAQKVTLKQFTQYTISSSFGNGSYQFYMYKLDGSGATSGVFNKSFTFVSGSDTEMYFCLYKSAPLGSADLTYTNIQLEEGSSAAAFEPFS
ncbi:hypothetical protein HPK19_19465 [Arthrobacter citreus]|nr:hypothetical protein HPK19_19465 [Arthrobacter citreus]